MYITPTWRPYAKEVFYEQVSRRNPRPITTLIAVALAVASGGANGAISAMHWCGGHPLRAVNSLMTAGLLALLLGLTGVPLRAQAQSLCETCEVFAGSGSTYHYWGDTGGVVMPVTVTWGNARYELGYFRMSTEQVLRSRVMAQPYNGLDKSCPQFGLVAIGLPRP